VHGSTKSLPYRPTFKLARAKDQPSYEAQGWTLTLFRDDRGNLFQRERDGQWERWSSMLDRLDEDNGLTLYKWALTKAEPEEYGDCLWLDGHALRDIRLIERKRLLRQLVRPPVLYADHFETRGMDLFQAGYNHDLEGIVAKLAAGRYEPTATTWVS
jgi:hypothetical protein